MSSATGSKKAIMKRLPKDILSCIALFLDPASYVAFIGTCSDFRVLKYDKKRYNSILDVIKIYRLVFEKSNNVFVTGSGGCGKTFVMNKIYNIAKKRKIRAVLTTTTGISSMNFDEPRTIHSFSGLRKGTISKEDLLINLANGKFKPPKVWTTTDLLLIDEASMLGARFFEKLDIVARHARNSDEPFGGLQVVLSGDFCQLPAVADKYCFTSDVWNALDLSFLCLRFPYRQEGDLQYYNFLQRIRLGEPTKQDLQFLQTRFEQTTRSMEKINEMEIKPTQILSKQKDVMKINNEEFDKIESPLLFTSVAHDSLYEATNSNGKRIFNPYDGNMTMVEAHTLLGTRAEHQASVSIPFKEGAQYILTFNFSVKNRHVNGSRCIYTNGKLKFADDSVRELNDCFHTFYYNIKNNIFLVRRQYALRLGYAITVHGSQGMSLDSALLDLGKSVFCSAQSYVSLSRLRNSDGLYVKDFVPTSIKTNSLAVEFTKNRGILPQKK